MRSLFFAFILSYTSYATEIGIASHYSTTTSSRTANGERLNNNSLTAAHKYLKFGTMVKVTNLSNKKSIVVRINDRGPFKKGRIIDLTKAGAKSLGFYEKGLTKVSVSVIISKD
jgi:rare lipoprotein A